MVRIRIVFVIMSDQCAMTARKSSAARPANQLVRSRPGLSKTDGAAPSKQAAKTGNLALYRGLTTQLRHIPQRRRPSLMHVGNKGATKKSFAGFTDV